MSKRSNPYPGVTWSKRYNTWQARSYYNYKNIWLGYFEDPAVAYAAILDFKSKNPYKKKTGKARSVPNIYVVAGDITYIDLSDSGDYTIIDTKNLPLVEKYTWRLDSKNKYCITKQDNKIEHLILPKTEGMVVDHINNNPLDNRLENIRLVPISANCYNKGKTKKNTASKYKGISIERKDCRYEARIQYNNKVYKLGRFPLTEAGELAAAKAYDVAAVKFFGPYAKTNLALGLY